MSVLHETREGYILDCHKRNARDGPPLPTVSQDQSALKMLLLSLIRFVLVNNVELVDDTMELARLDCGLDTGVKGVSSEVGELTASRCASEIF